MSLSATAAKHGGNNQSPASKDTGDGLSKETLTQGQGHLLSIKCLDTSQKGFHLQRKIDIISWPYRMHTGLQDPLCPGVFKGAASSFKLQAELGLSELFQRQQKLW